MARRAALRWLFVGALGLVHQLPACGGLAAREGTDPEGSGSKADASGGSGNLAIRCPEFLGLNACPQLHYSLASDLREAGSPCLILIEERDVEAVALDVAVDCEIIPSATLGGAGGADGGWFLDQESSPVTVVLWGSVCAQVEAGFDSVDVIQACGGPF